MLPDEDPSPMVPILFPPRVVLRLANAMNFYRLHADYLDEWGPQEVFELAEIEHRLRSLHQLYEE